VSFAVRQIVSTFIVQNARSFCQKRPASRPENRLATGPSVLGSARTDRRMFAKSSATPPFRAPGPRSVRGA
jgi:hypothetical protein